MFIKTKIKNKIAVITIDRASALNAMNPSVLNELNRKIVKIIDNNKVKAIILTGSGDKAFIAGADIKVMQSLNPEEAYQFGKSGQELTINIESSEKPIIAAINGFALGGGCEIALACHIRMASESAKFAQPEVKLGLIPGWGGTQRLPRIVGKGIATELIISGKSINAEEALRIGLVNKVFKDKDLMTNTIEFANSLLNNGFNAMSMSLKCINQSSGTVLNDGLDFESRAFRDLFKSDETREGLNAFVEKRKARFK